MRIPPQELPFPIALVGNDARSVNVPASPVVCPKDEELMARLLKKDSQALSLLFERYSRLVMGIAFRILHDHGEAEEIVQDSFLQVFQKAHLFDQSKGTARAWMVQIAFHRALDRKSYLDRRGFYFGTETGYIRDRLLDKTDLDREVAAKLVREQLQKAFEELSEVQRRTLELFYFEGLVLREISDQLEETLGNVRHHFYRGLEQLRKNTFLQIFREK
jgi:RNA polymerase sigma-70 factor (ECF subfamily)